MMNDIFIEKIVKRRKRFSDFLMIFAIVLLTIILSLVFIIEFPFLAMVLIFFAIALAYWLITSRYVEYEYIVTNGELDIDKIINERRRKNVFNKNAREFTVMARANSDKYIREIDSCRNIKDFTSRTDNADVWFIYLNKGKDSTLIFFEPSSEMIDNLYKYNSKGIYK